MCALPWSLEVSPGWECQKEAGWVGMVSAPLFIFNPQIYANTIFSPRLHKVWLALLTANKKARGVAIDQSDNSIPASLVHCSRQDSKFEHYNLCLCCWYCASYYKLHLPTHTTSLPYPAHNFNCLLNISALSPTLYKIVFPKISKICLLF